MSVCILPQPARDANLLIGAAGTVNLAAPRVGIVDGAAPAAYPFSVQPSRYFFWMNESASGQLVALRALESHSSFLPVR